MVLGSRPPSFCEGLRGEIGVKKRDYAAFHRSHINKVMAIAFVAAVFDGSLESGCEVVKLPLAHELKLLK